VSADREAAIREEAQFAQLERRACKPAERLLDGIIVALAEFDTETLVAIADYRDAIRPDGWMQRLIREYVDVWR